MNSLLIKKLIITNNEKYPEVTYSNPLLDKKVTRALARSFVKILTTCKENSNVNNNIRLSILEHIRKLCVIQPESHVQLNDAFIEHLCKLYEDNIQEANKSNTDIIEKRLNSFLVKTHKNLDLHSSVKLSFNPEVMQSLINLNDHSINRNNLSNTIYNDVLHWDTKEQNSIILNNLWYNNENLDLNILNDLSIKMKSHIESVILNVCTELLNNTCCNLNEMFTSHKEFNTICYISFKSSNCFQTVCSILNFIFIKSHFNVKIENLIKEYVNNVKCNCTDNLALLYPNYLTSVVPLLDMDVNDLPTPVQKTLIDSTLQCLKNINVESQTDLIMLLSHFPCWFDLYFS